MSEFERIGVCWWDADTDNEIEGMNFPSLLQRPLVGDNIHYWQDGTSERAWGDSGIKRDFVVVKVEHDLRFMPARGRMVAPGHIHMLNVYVRLVSA